MAAVTICSDFGAQENKVCHCLKVETASKHVYWTSLVAQWLRICLAMQRMWVQSLVGEVRSYMPQSKEVHVL